MNNHLKVFKILIFKVIFSGEIWLNDVSIFFSLLTYLFGTGGDTFILLSFLDQILLADVFSKVSKLFWR